MRHQKTPYNLGDIMDKHIRHPPFHVKPILVPSVQRCQLGSRSCLTTHTLHQGRFFSEILNKTFKLDSSRNHVLVSGLLLEC